MLKHPSFSLIYLLFVFSIVLISLTDSKGFGGSKGGGGFRGGSKGAGTFGGASSYNRPSGYGNNMGKMHSGSSFRGKAMSFAAGAAGGIAAYSIMRSMAGSHHYRSGQYGPGYGTGEVCYNNEDFNGTTFGQFRCPMNNFPYEAKYCCGEYGKQFCCIRERQGRTFQGASNFIWIILIIVILLIIIMVWARHQRQRQKDVVMIPTEVPINEPQGPPYYQPAPPPTGYPPPPQGNPYGPPPPQNYAPNYNPYQQPQQMPYPPQQQPYNPYPGGPSY